MTVTRTIQTVKVSSLRRHPLSLKIYGRDEESLAEDIKLNGLHVPPQVTPDWMTVDGHRRIAGAKLAGLETIQVVVRHDLNDPLEVERAVILANRYREKTNAQKAAEAAELLRIETAIGERVKRQNLKNLRENSKVPPVGRSGEADTETQPDEDVSGDKNRANERVGEAIGWSKNTVEAAVEVHEAIEAADPETAADLTETLNEEGVKPALRKARAAKAAANGEATVVRDKLGNRVPGGLEVTFSDGERQFNANILALGKIVQNLSELRQKPWGIRLVQQLERKIVSVADTLRIERPYCGCPWCKGTGRIRVDGSECNRCIGSGWMTQTQYGLLDDATRSEIPGASVQ